MLEVVDMTKRYEDGVLAVIGETTEIGDNVTFKALPLAEPKKRTIHHVEVR